MIAPSTLKFLKDLAVHNNRAWFKKHMETYREAHADFLGEVERLIVRIAIFDPPLIEVGAEDCMFRIYRDTRFSGNKAPYKTNFGAFMTDRGRKLVRAGYYFHVEPGNCFLAGGLYMPPGSALRSVRKAVAEDPAAFRKIIRSKPFVKTFGVGLPGDRLKTAPRGYTRDHPAIDLLQLKSYEVMHPVTERQVTSRPFTGFAAGVFRKLVDFNGYLNRALES